MDFLPTGKLPPELLTSLLNRVDRSDPSVVMGPGVGLDCAVIDFGDRMLVAKSDPITFTADEIGWYAVHINANDLATTGTQPRWFLATVLLPEKNSNEKLVSGIFEQIEAACRTVGGVLVGGHTEITAGLDRPIMVGTMLGEISSDRLITPRGARPGDCILLTKGVPIEATSILAREFPERLSELSESVLKRARDYLYRPGISIVPEALAAAKTGGVSAMHDPTEGGIAAALWELSQAAEVGLEIDKEAIHVPHEADIICQTLGVDPLEAIASGALLLTVHPQALEKVSLAIEAEGVIVSEIGKVTSGTEVAMRTEEGFRLFPRPPRDALARLFDENPPSG